eukprot:TRINITY_DN103895_c0_g1_i1.p1 TRINITY_DN103895_c0_g1~~TRINITY_DN103895_c0_g1_i1.p1  ORF type:complete len:268 (-),score=77.19 TRINITY_DN103895_c0_g1_i1:98-901(-)
MMEDDGLTASKALRQMREESVRDRGDEMRAAITTVSRSAGPHEEPVWFNAADWQMQDCEKPASPHWIRAYLNTFGYSVVGPQADQWAAGEGAEEEGRGPFPQLQLTLKEEGHEEHAGHTWYLIDCVLMGGGNVRLGENGALSWRSPRRLAQLRESLHDPVKAALGEAYVDVFAEAPFASRGGFGGTTAKLQKWLPTLSGLINDKQMSPHSVAMVLMFFLGPPPKQPAGAAKQPAAVAVLDGLVGARVAAEPIGAAAEDENVDVNMNS